MAEYYITVLNTFTKTELIRTLDMAQYYKFNERIVIRNGSFVIDLKAIDTSSQWLETMDRERTKAIKRLLKRVRKAPQELFKVNKEKQNG